MRAKPKLAVAALLLLMPVTGLLIWMRTDSFQNWIRARVERALSRGDLRAKADRAELDLWRLTLRIHGLKVSATGRFEPFLEIDRIEARLAPASLLQGPIRIEDLFVNRPVVNLRRSADGSSNLQGIDWNRSLKGGPMEEGLTIGRLRIGEGRLNASFSADRFELIARQLVLSLKPQADDIQVHLEGRELSGRLGEQTMVQLALTVDASVSRERIVIQLGRVTTQGSASTVQGRVEMKRPPEYALALQSLVQLEEIAQGFHLGEGLRGEVRLQGRIEGQGEKYRFAGQAASPDLSLDGFRLAGASLNAETERPLSLLTALFGVGRDPAMASGTASLAGSLKIDRLSRSFLVFTSVSGDVSATPDQISVNRLRARLFGGEIAGAASWSDQQGARFAGSTAGLQVTEVLSTFGYAGVPLAGMAGGPMVLEARRLHRGISGGFAELSIEPGSGDVLPALLPAVGSIKLNFAPQLVSITTSNLRVGKAELAFVGNLTWDGVLSATVKLESPDLSELRPLASALDLGPAELTGGMMGQLSGDAAFEGSLERSRQRYSLQGELRGRGWPLKSGSVESWRGGLTLSSSGVKLSRTQIRLADGAAIDLDLQHEFGEAPDTRAAASFRNANLADLSRLLGFESPVTGRAAGSLTVTSLKPVAEFNAQLAVSNGRIAYDGYGADFLSLTGRLEAGNNRLRLEGARMRMVSGSIEASGAYHRGNQELSLAASGHDLPMANLFTAAGRSPGPVDGVVRFNLRGGGTRSAPELQGEVAVDRLTVNGEAAGDAVVSLTADGGPLRMKGSVTLFGQLQLIEGEFDPADRQRRLVARAELREFDLRPLLAFARDLPRDLQSRMTGKAQLTYPFGAPEEMQAHVELPEVLIQLGEYSLRNDGPVVADWKGRRITLQPVRISGNDTNFGLGGAMDLPQAGLEKLDLNLEGQVNLQVLRIFMPNIASAGSASVKAGIRGRLRDPRMTGLADIENFSMRMVDFPVALEQGAGRIRFNSNQTLVEQFRAKANGGDLNLSGGMLVRNYRPDRWQFNIRAEGLQLRYPKGIRSVIDATLSLSGTRELQILSGTASLRTAEITDEADVEGWITGTTQTVTRTARTGIGNGLPIALDLRIQGLDTISFRREAVDAVGSAWFRVSGPLSGPVISGRASVSRGHMSFLGREYQITRGTLNLPDRIGEKPRFDLEAESDIGGYRVIVTIAGTTDRFQATPHSEPALPPLQVLSLMTTGDIGSTTDTTLGASQTNVGLATALVTEAISKRIELGTRYFGINRFQLAPLALNRGSDPTARISVGRQVTRDLSITYSTNVASTQDQIIVVEYRLSNRFSFVGTRDQDGKFSLDFRIRKRF
ncbi:MAG: translocation/assembly module TamB domain-containing protein [Acidobacteria bacterium]|nr:translocation/assembly module TamB domain-containing protein [Acidobacteriota bacterium]